MYDCPKCEKQFESYNGLRLHARMHGLTSEDVHVLVKLDGKLPTCACGCGEVPTFRSGEFKKYVQGHQARVHNNWGHNKKAVEKSKKTRKKLWAEGELEPWNKGLTKEDHPALKKQGQSIAETWTDERRSQYSDMMKKMWSEGSLEVRIGPDSANWKGGTSEITHLVRSRKRLYTEWKYPILERDGFACTECGNTDNLEVHHDDVTMAEILGIFVSSDREYTWKQKLLIVDQVIDYHVSHEVSGTTLCVECHTALHPSYNLA